MQYSRWTQDDLESRCASSGGQLTLVSRVFQPCEQIIAISCIPGFRYNCLVLKLVSHSYLLWFQNSISETGGPVVCGFKFGSSWHLGCCWCLLLFIGVPIAQLHVDANIFTLELTTRSTNTKCCWYVILISDGSPFKRPPDYHLNPLLFPAFGRTSSKWEVFTCVCWSRERWHFPADGANIAAALLASNTAQDRRNQDLRQILPFGPRLTNLREKMWRCEFENAGIWGWIIRWYENKRNPAS